jgi:predicted nucleotidyltransferase
MKAPPLSHLTPNERSAIAEYLARIRGSFPGRILSVTLFGSKARGDADAESDIDLLVLVDAEDNMAGETPAIQAFRSLADAEGNMVGETPAIQAFRSELWRIASDVSLEYNVVLSVRVYAQDHWAEARRIRLPLYRAIAADGISLVPGHPPTQPAGQREFEG